MTGKMGETRGVLLTKYKVVKMKMKMSDADIAAALKFRADPSRISRGYVRRLSADAACKYLATKASHTPLNNLSSRKSGNRDTFFANLFSVRQSQIRNTSVLPVISPLVGAPGLPTVPSCLSEIRHLQRGIID